MSAATVARLKERWNGELAEWRSRRLDEHEVVYVWVDGVYVKAGLEREKAAILVVIGALSDGTKTVLSVVPGYRESTQSWSEALRDLRDRGMNCPKLVVGDGHLGIWGALRNVYPDAREQRCWNHKIINVLDKLPKRQHEQAKLMLRGIPYAGSRAQSLPTGLPVARSNCIRMQLRAHNRLPLMMPSHSGPALCGHAACVANTSPGRVLCFSRPPRTRALHPAVSAPLDLRGCFQRLPMKAPNGAT